MLEDNSLHYRKLEKMYLSANLNNAIYDTTTVSIESEKATIGLEVVPKYHHALGAMHGSVYFKLLDDAAFFAVNSIVTDVFVLTTNFNINLVRPVVSGKIRAEGTIKFSSRSLWIAEATLYNEANKVVAFGTGHFAKSRVMLSEDIGYKL